MTNWLDGYFENKTWLGLGSLTDAALAAKYVVQQDPVTGAFEVAGVEVTGVSSYTWTDFVSGSFDLTVARYVTVSDRHSTSDAASTQGSLWRIDPAAVSDSRKRKLMSAPIYYATLAAAPSPIDYPGLQIYAANLKSAMTSDGANYRINGPYITLLNLPAEVPHAGAALTDEYIYKSIAIPRDINGDSLLQDLDYIEVVRAHIQKTGTTDKIMRAYSWGYTVDTAETELISTTHSDVNRTRSDAIAGIERRSNTTVRFKGGNQATPLLGSTDALHSSDVTVDAMDNGSNDTYLIYSGKIVPTAALVDTALVLKELEVRYVKGY